LENIVSPACSPEQAYREIYMSDLRYDERFTAILHCLYVAIEQVNNKLEAEALHLLNKTIEQVNELEAEVEKDLGPWDTPFAKKAADIRMKVGDLEATANAHKLDGVCEMLTVYQLDEVKLHVSLKNIVSDRVAMEGAHYSAEGMGAFLTEVALAIAGEYRECFKTERADGDLFAAICDGFKECAAATLE
jgi:hypothetical protein